VWESSEHTALPARAELIDSDDTLNLLGRLVERSLVVAEIGLEAEDLPPPLAGGLRYRMLESVREYARERLVQSGEEVTLRHRHREYFMGVAEQADDGLRGPDQGRWLDLLQREMDNFRAALGWSVESEARLRLAAALWRYWYQRGPVSEGRSWLEGSLARSRYCSPEARARALTGVGNLAGQQADYAAAFAYLEECLGIQRERGNRRGEAEALNNLGIIARYQHDSVRAQALLEESLAVNREIGRPETIAAALVNLWVVAHEEGRGAASRAWLEEAREIYAGQGDSWRLAVVLCNLGILDRRGGNPDGAESAYSEALGRFLALNEGANIALCLNGLGCVALDRGDFERAMRLFAIEERHRQVSGVPTPQSDIAQRESELERLREVLGPEGAERIWRDTSELPLEQAVAWALNEQPTTT
jgi:non-specific serine/threonine protein kinase